MPDNGTEDLRRLEQALLDAATRADPARLDALLDPEFAEIGALGTVSNRQQTLASLAAEDGSIKRLATDLRIRSIAPGVALVNYRLVRTDQRTGIASRSWRTSIWRQDASGAWRILFHQGTPAAPAADPAPG
jgi:hypothetical protein